jgi:enamine deaminase RidA (YjgF/YER057c/UK114 family)
LIGRESSGRVLRLSGDPASPYEEPFAASRVVRAGQLVFVGGTTSIEPSGVVLGETPYEQAVAILRKIGHELSRAGASLHDVIQTRIYTTDITRAEEIGRAHHQAFSASPPVTTMVEVSRLIDPRMTVEIEAVALVREPGRVA